MTAQKPVVLLSSSAAMDGGLTAVADVSGAMTTAGAADDYARTHHEVVGVEHPHVVGLTCGEGEGLGAVVSRSRRSYAGTGPWMMG